MSATDWFMLAVALPLIIVVVWVQTVRVWRTGVDVSAGVTWFTGRASTAGYHAFLLPAAIFLLLVWVGIVLSEVGSGAIETLGGWFMGVSLLFMLLSFWMWLFARPRFLVPPHLRGRPGWVGALRQEHRAARSERRKAREYPRDQRGKRARREP